MALMTMTAYICTAESGVVDKTPYITQIGSTYTIRPTDNLDIEFPAFIVQYSAALLKCNYIYVSEFNRYYYAKFKTKPGGEIIIECTSDPLMSFKTEISECDVLILRSESVGAPTMFEDSKLPVYPCKENITSIVMQETSGLFTANGDECYVLTVIGGDTSL